jgi:DNA-binding SARP family transcriptional activator/ABC-type transport system substrate-binding protein/streptogramin lyase
MDEWALEFRLLGPVEVWSNGERLPLAGAKQRAILAILLLHANRVVPRERLLSDVWGTRAGESEHSLDVHISRLRKTFERSGNGGVLVRRGRGYLLSVDPSAIDLERFRRLLRDAGEAAAVGRPVEEADLLREALGLWHGRALSDVGDDEVARSEIAGLEELRLAALEQRIDAELALGRDAHLVGELEALVCEHPLRERLRAQLMLALYRTGRQADALSLYSQTRRFMVDELGLEPSGDLRELQRRILVQDPTLTPSGSDVEAPDNGPDAAPERSPRKRFGRLLFAAAGVVIAAGVAASVALLTGGSTSHVVSDGFSVAFLDARSGKLLGTAPAAAGASEVRFGAGWVWDNRGSGVLSRIDPNTFRVTRSISAGGTMGPFAVGQGAVWLLADDSQTLLRLDLHYGVVTKRIALPRVSRPRIGAIAESAGIAVGAGSVWVAHGLAEVDRVDPATGRLLHRFSLDDASLVAYGGGAVWAGSSDLGTIAKIDPRTNAIVTTARIRPWICCLAVGGGYVWASNSERIWKLSTGGQLLDTVKTLSETGEIAYGDNALWFTNDAAGTVTRVDAQTDTTRQYHLGHLLTGIGVRGRIVAVSVSPNATDLVKNVHGKVLQIRFSQDWIDDTDPAVAAAPGTNEWPWLQQLFYATGARLLSYRDAPAPAGWRLAPEVAATLPAVSRDGRTYNFEIRPGFRFSPPSNQPVTAQTFQYSIERALSPQLGLNAPAVAVASDIVGVRAFRAGRASHITGITTRGNKLVITLVHRAPDFPERIALSYFSAVPIGTPVVANGLRDPIPSAGPYYLTVNSGGVAAVLRRNPNYHGPRAQNLDAVIYRTQPQIGDAVAAIARGRADNIAEPDSTLAPTSQLARAYGQKVAGQRRYVLAPMLATDELVFNTEQGLFRDARLRRAVNLALDRPALAAALGDLVTDRILPPGIPGFQNQHVYPLNGPDLRRARALAAGHGGRAVLAVCAQPACLELGRIVAADLARIGIHLALHQYAGDIASTTHRRAADIVLVRAFAPYPDPIATLQAALGNHDARNIAALAQLDRRQRLDPAEQADLGLIRTQAPVAAFGTPTIPELFSSRVGCKTFQPLFYGVDLTSLCLRSG